MYEFEDISDEFEEGKWYSVIIGMAAYRVRVKNNKAANVFDQNGNTVPDEEFNLVAEAIEEYINE